MKESERNVSQAWRVQSDVIDDWDSQTTCICRPGHVCHPSAPRGRALPILAHGHRHSSAHSNLAGGDDAVVSASGFESGTESEIANANRNDVCAAANENGCETWNAYESVHALRPIVLAASHRATQQECAHEQSLRYRPWVRTELHRAGNLPSWLSRALHSSAVLRAARALACRPLRQVPGPEPLSQLPRCPP